MARHTLFTDMPILPSEAGKQRLNRDTTRDVTRQEITALNRKSVDLKDLVAELSLDLHRLKKTSTPCLDEGCQRMSVDEKAQVLRRLSNPQAPSRRFCQNLEYPRATGIAGEPDTATEALIASSLPTC